ncbi:hypothetical protein [Candidatus Mesenet endosymbiont of Agriotes lineatus]|uniref:hypothetical protein n=1 Tax=Candidatus Mesenet endosymbiont of Agriotes lineatus TaxID=3077948 RepID=UPI0030D31E5F
MPKSNTLSEQYDDFIDNYIKPKFESLAENDGKIRMFYKKNKEQDQSVAFVSSNTATVFELSNNNQYCSARDQEIGNLSCIIYHEAHKEVHKNCITQLHSGSIEDKFLRFVIQQFFDKTNPVIPYNSTNYEANELFTVEQLVQKFKMCQHRSAFYKIDITNMTENNPTEYCRLFTTAGKVTLDKFNNSEAVDAWFDSAKSEIQNITDALEENGTVSPGSGLMPDQEVCYPKRPYFSSKEYISIIDNLFGKKLEKFENELSFKADELYTDSNVYVGFSRFEITDIAGNTMKVSYLGENKRWNLKVNDENLTFKCDQPQSRAFEVITQYVYYNVYLKENGNSTRVKLENCKPFNKTDFLTSLKKIPNTKGYRYYFTDGLSHKRPVSKISSPFNCNSKPIEAAAALTTIVSSILLLTNTTPAIGYNNSTNTSIISANHSTTTSKPEQDDNIDKSHIAVIVGFALLIFGIGVVCAICCYVNRRTSNKKHTEPMFVKYEQCDDNINNKCATLPIIEEGQEEEVLENEQGTVAKRDISAVTEDTQPLLPNNNQQNDSTSGGIGLSDEDASKVANAVKENFSCGSNKTPSPPLPLKKQTQAQIR